MEEDQLAPIQGKDMTGLLTAAAIITTIVLLISATHSSASVTASDPYKRGPWGIATWHLARYRALDPHERRWQTSLLSGKDTETRWRDLVGEISELERMSGTTPFGLAPDTYDGKWVEASLANLEAALAAKSPATTPQTVTTNGTA